MNYLKGLWISLHKRGIQAILLAGCVLGFGLGQTLGASYGPFADPSHRAPTGKVGTAVAASRAGADLGNDVAGQRGASATHTTVLAQGVSATHMAAQAQTPSGKGHQANTDGKGKGHGGKKPPKTKGHRMENDGGHHGKQSKDSGNKRHDKSGRAIEDVTATKNVYETACLQRSN